MRILNRWSVHALVLMLFSGGAALAELQGHELLFTNAQNATAITDADRRAIYGQLGLKPGPDGKSLVFVDSECPSIQPGSGEGLVWTEDLNGDQRPEVFVSLGSTCMFGYAGTGIFLFIGDGAGNWKMHNLGAGVVVVQETRHQGYADLMIGGPGFCQPVQRWDGTTYVFDRNVAEQPGGCDAQ
jgi:hypothetical protein